MTVTAVLGGQYGSEGKGKVVAYLASEMSLAIRTGGPNAGHTVEADGTFYKLQSVPCTFMNPTCLLAIGAGGIIDPVILQREIDLLTLTPERLKIDPHAVVITEENAASERELMKRIGSTGKGVGSALAAKILRQPDVVLAKNVGWMEPYLEQVAYVANSYIDEGKEVCLEGTQGFGLSIHYGIYPYVTSRDTTAGALCSDAGLSPRLVKEIILVVRTYPIRVAGNSGPLADEIDWKTVTEESGSSKDLVEITTVTRNVRRVGRFDVDLVKRACILNRPTQIALTFADYITSQDHGVRALADLSAQTRAFIAQLEEICNTPVKLISTGPKTNDMIDLR